VAGAVFAFAMQGDEPRNNIVVTSMILLEHIFPLDLESRAAFCKLRNFRL
jgi:hypothetical protein